MIDPSLEPQGRLTGFTAVPPQFDKSKGPWPAADWNALFAASGLDPARFAPAEPQWTPSVMADERAAWTGAYPEAPEIPIRVEAAAFHGKPVSFVHVLELPDSPRPSPPGNGGRSTGDLVLLALELIVLIGSVPFARYNLRLGRGDTRGALRLGLFALCVCLGSWVAGGTHVANVREADLFMRAVMRAVFGAVSLAFTYISFEPFVRRRWPQTIVSWSRVLAGGWRDPLVGRDVLLGTVIGVGMGLIQGFGGLLYRILDLRGVRVTTDLTTLLGGRYLAGDVLFLIVDVLNKSLGTLFLIFLCLIVLRKQWLAASVIVFALAAMLATNEVNPYIAWPVNIVFFALMVFTLMRFGLLTLVVALFVSIFQSSFPLTTDFSVWYSGSVAFSFAVVIALAVFGFRTALAGQPLFRDDCA